MRGPREASLWGSSPVVVRGTGRHAGIKQGLSRAREGERKAPTGSTAEGGGAHLKHQAHLPWAASLAAPRFHHPRGDYGRDWSKSPQSAQPPPILDLFFFRRESSLKALKMTGSAVQRWALEGRWGGV